MNPKTKKFDSVELMRRLRAQLSAEMAAMSPEEFDRAAHGPCGANPNVGRELGFGAAASFACSSVIRDHVRRA